MSEKSFTLIELIVVIAIIAILAAIIAPNAFKAIEKAKTSRAVSDHKAIKTATYALYADTGQWPSGLNQDLRIKDSDLLADKSGFAGWDGPYLEKNPDPHSWGGWYMFEGQDDYGKGSRHELILEFENHCLSGSNNGCPIPKGSALKIDETVDDGDFTTGDVRYGSPGLSDMGWVLKWDAF